MFCCGHPPKPTSVQVGGQGEDSAQVSGSPALSIWRWPPSFGASKPPLAPQLAAKSKREALARVSGSLGPTPGGVAHRFWLQSLTRISHMVRGCKGSGNCSLLICPGEGGRFAEGIMMSLPQKRGTLLSRSVTAQQTSTQGTVIPVIKAWALTTCKPSSWEEGQERLTEPATDFEKTRRAEHGRPRQEAGRAVSSSRRWREQSSQTPASPADLHAPATGRVCRLARLPLSPHQSGTYPFLKAQFSSRLAARPLSSPVLLCPLNF